MAQEPSQGEGSEAPRPAVLNSTDAWLERLDNRLEQLCKQLAPTPRPGPPTKKATSHGKTVVKGD